MVDRAPYHLSSAFRTLWDRCNTSYAMLCRLKKRPEMSNKIMWGTSGASLLTKANITWRQILCFGPAATDVNCEVRILRAAMKRQGKQCGDSLVEESNSWLFARETNGKRRIGDGCTQYTTGRKDCFNTWPTRRAWLNPRREDVCKVKWLVSRKVKFCALSYNLTSSPQPLSVLFYCMGR